MLRMSRKLGARLLLAFVLSTTALFVSTAIAPTASAQAPPTQPLPPSIESGPSDILDDYQNAMGQWETAATSAAATLFALLAAIEVTWTAIVMTLEKTDIQAWVATVIKKMMGIGIFWALLKYGATWLPAIVNSFIRIGQNGSNQTALNPSSILVEGLNISGTLFSTAGQMGLSFDFGTAICLAFAGIGIFLSFAIVCVHFVMAMVESYIVLGAGYIFLGFGGSRWTSSYVERYIGLAVNVGVRLMVLYLLIGLGQTFATQWETRAASIQYTSAGVQTAFGLLGSTLIYAAVCWTAPKLVGSIMGGSPSLTGGDLIATGVAAAAAGLTAAAALASGGAVAAGALAEVGAATAVAGGGGAAAGGAAAGGGGGGAAFFSSTSSLAGAAGATGADAAVSAAQVAPPTAAGGTQAADTVASGGGSTVPPPSPSSGSSASHGLLSNFADTARGIRDKTTSIHQQLPPDSSGGAAPPSGNIGHSTD
jgi:type IV secretion system protein TrbL